MEWGQWLASDSACLFFYIKLKKFQKNQRLFTVGSCCEAENEHDFQHDERRRVTR
jgi:hypothetical protein